MGFKAWYKAQDERHKSYVADQRQGVSGTYGLSAFVTDGKITAQGVSRPVAGAVAEFESGADRKRTTVTRVATGAILAGPAGAIVGGLFRKDKSRGYVTVTFPDSRVVVLDGPIKDEKKLREFAQVVSAAGRYYAEQ